QPTGSAEAAAPAALANWIGGPLSAAEGSLPSGGKFTLIGPIRGAFVPGDAVDFARHVGRKMARQNNEYRR
ncbi:MAG TPA: hypothetical protein VGX93_06910, partial [Chthoniobacterales bacterium]|nr:hypothetical protein [Chthoniobacterales bacterium]